MPPAPSRTTPFRLRRARADDLAAITGLEAAAFQPHRRASRASLRRSLTSPRQSVWVVDAPRGPGARGRVLCGLLVLWHFPRRIRVYDIAAHPDWQGQGLGTRLLGHAEKLARNAGAADVSLEADAADERLLAWYRRQGYVEVGLLRDFYAPGRHAFRLRKWLRQVG